MKKLIALLTACILLMAALPALAEEEALHTFAGIPWDTPKSRFADVATEKVGIPFEVYANEVFYDEAPAFIIQEGYYSIFGMPIDTYRGIWAHYARTEALLNREIEWTDDAGWVFDAFSCVSAGQDIPSEVVTDNTVTSEIGMPQDVISRMMERYGAPTATFVGFGHRYYDLNYYVVPDEEQNDIVWDATKFAEQNGQICFKVIFVFSNVFFTMDASMPTTDVDGSYTLRIDYLNHPATASDFTDQDDLSDLPVFPFLHGEIPYIVIEP